MIQRIFLFLFLIIILPDWYIYAQYIKKLTKKIWIRLLYWLPSILLLFFLCYMLRGNNFTPERIEMTGIYMIVFLMLTVPKGIFCLLSLLFNTLNIFWKKANRFGWMVASLGAAVSLGIMIYGTWKGPQHYQVKHVAFRSKEIPPEFEGYKIVQFSDLHIGTLSRQKEEVSKMVQIINEQKGDLIVFTGDLINNFANELDGFGDVLKQLKAKDGVYSVLGNHDYSPYYKWKNKREQQNNLIDLKRRELSYGWHLLNNDHTLLHRGDTCIALIGVENDGIPPFPEKGDLFLATQNTEGLFKVLLSHDPTHWRRKVLPTTDIQFMLAGHTHGMQFMLGKFSPASFVYEEWQGLYKRGNRGLYVNTGIGEVMIPFRFGAWPEITVITLSRKMD